jgi:tRNA-(ms[2]io[6]A)-hydroxylase
MSAPDSKKKSLPVAPSESPAKRKLPLLPKVEVAEESDEERPPWHWSAIGAVAIFVLWLPLTFLTAALGKHLLAGATDPGEAHPSAHLAIAGLNLLAFALAALGGGALVGRFGATAGLKEATVAGFATGSIAWATIAFQGAWLPLWTAGALLVLLAVTGAGASRAGGWLGLRGRRT